MVEINWFLSKNDLKRHLINILFQSESEFCCQIGIGRIFVARNWYLNRRWRIDSGLDDKLPKLRLKIDVLCLVGILLCLSPVGSLLKKVFYRSFLPKHLNQLKSSDPYRLLYLAEMSSLHKKCYKSSLDESVNIMQKNCSDWSTKKSSYIYYNCYTLRNSKTLQAWIS